jgi:FtsZ-interacting cell division protein ZipA
MEWTYTWYTVASYCIPIGVIIIIMTLVFIAFYSSKKGKEFVQEKIVGVDLTKADDDDDVDNGTRDNKTEQGHDAENDKSEPLKRTKLRPSIVYRRIDHFKFSVSFCVQLA